MFSKAIVRPPSVNFAEGLTTISGAAPDHALALQQHTAYCEALERCGLTLTRLESDEHYPDSTFVEDTAVIVDALPHGRATAPSAIYPLRFSRVPARPVDQERWIALRKRCLSFSLSYFLFANRAPSMAETFAKQRIIFSLASLSARMKLALNS